MRLKEKIIFIGGGGHAKVLLELVKQLDTYSVVGILDSGKQGSVLGVPVVGNDTDIDKFIKEGIKKAVLAVGSSSHTKKRKELFMRFRQKEIEFPPLIHPKSIISSEFIEFPQGIQVMANAILQPSCNIDENTIVNTGAIVEHDCIIGKNVHICPGAVISGGCVIEDGVFVGAGTVIKQCIKIGENAVIGAGSLVLEDVQAQSTVFGVPARKYQ